MGSSQIWLINIPLNSSAPVVTHLIVKALRKNRESPIFEKFAISLLSIFSGCKALSHANSDRIIYFNKDCRGMAVQSQCASNKRRQVN